VELLRFLLLAIGVSLSGVMAPGAVTAATIAQGTRNRWAGVLISLGHGLVEIPLIFLLMAGLAILFQAEVFQIIVGLLGGGFLIWMGVGLLRARAENPQAVKSTSGPVMTGLVLSAGNPYFLLWWATVGLNLALQAKSFGWIALALFALVHWSCDLIWLTILSFTSYHGTNLLGPRNQRIILWVCGIALVGFGVYFLRGAIVGLRGSVA